MKRFLSATQKLILQALANGYLLKSHRYMDGKKVYQLHASDNTRLKEVRRAAVESLQRRELIYTNHKFPAAMYHLTQEGKTLAETLPPNPNLPSQGMSPADGSSIRQRGPSGTSQ